MRTDTRWARPHEKIPLPTRRAGRPVPVSFPSAGAQRNGGEMRTNTRWARPREKIPLPARRAGRPIPVSFPRAGGQRQYRAPRVRQARRRKSRAPARVGTASQKIPLPGSPTRPAAQGGRSPFLSRAPAGSATATKCARIRVGRGLTKKFRFPPAAQGGRSPFLSRAPAGNGNAGRPAPGKPGGENPERRRAAQRRRNAHGYALGAASRKNSASRPAAQGGRSPFLSRAPAALPARSLPFSGAGVAL